MIKWVCRWSSKQSWCRCPSRVTKHWGCVSPRYNVASPIRTCVGCEVRLQRSVRRWDEIKWINCSVCCLLTPCVYGYIFWGVVCSLQLSLISPQHMETTLQCTGVFAESCWVSWGESGGTDSFWNTVMSRWTMVFSWTLWCHSRLLEVSWTAPGCRGQIEFHRRRARSVSLVSFATATQHTLLRIWQYLIVHSLRDSVPCFPQHARRQ